MAWTVYVHKFPNKKNYVGITSRPVNKRWGYNGVGYKKQVVYNAIKKYGWNNIEHCILDTQLSKEQAEEKEKFYIKEFNSLIPFGYNIELGGNVGKELSQEFRETVLSKCHKGKTLGVLNGLSKQVDQFSLTGEFIRHWETIADAAEYCSDGKTRDSSQIVSCCEWNKEKNQHYTAYKCLWIRPSNFLNFEEEKNEIYNRVNYLSVSYTRRYMPRYTSSLKDYSNICVPRIHQPHTAPNQKKIDQFDFDGNFIKRYNSCKEAQNSLKTKSQIIAYDGKNFRYGYIWLYPQDFKTWEQELSRVQECVLIKKNYGKNNCHVILQYDVDCNFIAEFPSVAQAERITGVKRTNIGNCLTGKTQRAGGYIWKYKNPDTIITPKISKIEQYSLSGEFIQKYNSLSEASNTTNCDVAAIRRCCRGEVKSCGNFIWKYEQIF